MFSFNVLDRLDYHVAMRTEVGEWLALSVSSTPRNVMVVITASTVQNTVVSLVARSQEVNLVNVSNTYKTRLETKNI